MNRREFTKSLAAAAATPALPVKALGVAAGPIIPQALYAKAAHWASVWHLSSLATFRNVLDVDHDMAEAVFTRLQSDGYLSAPDKFGFAYCARPWRTAAAISARGVAALKADTAPRKNHLKDLADHLLKEDGDAGAEAEIEPEDAPQDVEPAEQPKDL